MTDAPLKRKTLSKLKASRLIALDNFEFYKYLYDDMSATPERENIGRAMAQKQSYIAAVEAILKNHDINVPEAQNFEAANDCDDVLKNITLGEHLEQEERFCDSVKACISTTNDELTNELLEHHLQASKIAVTAIKETSLKI